MGVDFYDCEYCGESTNSCASHHIPLDNLDEYWDVCSSCYDLLISEKYIIPSDKQEWGYIRREMSKDNSKDNSIQISYYDDYSSLINDSGYTSKNGTDHKFGICVDTLRDRVRDALTGNNNYGGMTEDDIRKKLNLYNYYNHPEKYYVGFRNHKPYTHSVSWEGGECRNSIAIEIKINRSFINPNLYAETISKIKSYVTRMNLQGVPYLLTEDVTELWYFCFPLENKKIIWFDSLEEFVENRLSGEHIGKYCYKWTAANKLIEELLDRKILKEKCDKKVISKYENLLSKND
jgi:hypothetical protein